MTFASTAFRAISKFVLGAALLAAPAAALGQVFVSVNFAPPNLPVYAQPMCPGDGFLWTPGYWAYTEDGYYWVPGTWVEPPTVGYLWTPGYWGYGQNAYLFHPGYWGPHIGFYGGVNYGFGYGGRGYQGGYWDRDRFQYNRTVNNINVTNVTNVYVKNVTVINNNYKNVSYNGGKGGVPDRARPEELKAGREQRAQPTQNQIQHQQLAAQDKAQFASVNKGRPQVTAAATPEAFRQTVQRGGLGTTPANATSVRPAVQPGTKPTVTPAVRPGQPAPTVSKDIQARPQSGGTPALPQRNPATLPPSNGAQVMPQDKRTPPADSSAQARQQQQQVQQKARQLQQQAAQQQRQQAQQQQQQQQAQQQRQRAQQAQQQRQQQQQAQQPRQQQQPRQEQARPGPEQRQGSPRQQ